MITVPVLETLAVDWAAAGVVVVTIDREKSANTISAQLSRDLLALVEIWTKDPDLRAVVITGRGDRFFCAGADLRDPEHGPGWLDLGRRAFDAVAALPVPTIAALNGVALGGGTELALACDRRIASSTARLGLPEIKIGALPGAGGLTRLQHLVGPAIARDLVLTGRHVPATEAQTLGLVDQLTDPSTVVQTAIDYALEIGQYAGYALRTAKEVFNHSLGRPVGDSLEVEYRLVDEMATPEEFVAEQRRAAERDPAYARIFGAVQKEGSSYGAR